MQDQNKILVGLGALMLAGGLLITTVLYSQSVKINNLTILIKNQNSLQPQSQKITEEKVIENEIKQTVKSDLDKYLVTKKGNLKDGFTVSLYKSDGSFFKTVATLPNDYLYVAGSLKVYGSKIYFLSGDLKSKSVLNEIDIKTNVIKTLSFTLSNTTNQDGSIRKWAVSDDMQKIAWSDGTEKINTTNLDGTEKNSLEVENKNLKDLKFASNNVELFILLNDKNSLIKWNFVDDKQTSLAISGIEAVSPSGRYVVYTTNESVILKDTIKNISNSIVLDKGYTLLESFIFSSDEKSLVFDEIDKNDLLPIKAKILNIEDNQIDLVKEGYSMGGFITDSTMVLVSDFTTYIIQNDGKGFEKIVNEEYIGNINKW